MAQRIFNVLFLCTGNSFALERQVREIGRIQLADKREV